MKKALWDFMIARCWHAYRAAAEGNYRHAAALCRDAAASDEEAGEALEAIYLNFERGDYCAAKKALADFLEPLIIAEVR